MTPYFYHPNLEPVQELITLDVDTSRHCIQVLRMSAGQQISLTDGKGRKAEVRIVAPDKKKCVVAVTSREELLQRPVRLTLGIAFTKNKSRNEWLLEKATEIGIDHICPLICARSEKEKWNKERMQSILVSAMLQSQQCFLPTLHDPLPFKQVVTNAPPEQKLIAHCIDAAKREALGQQMQTGQNTMVLIGPEGDFTQDEVLLSVDNDFRPVSLGVNRLRTETAGIYVCTAFNVLNYA